MVRPLEAFLELVRVCKVGDGYTQCLRARLEPAGETHRSDDPAGRAIREHFRP
jgi:hypothetical protein